MIWNDNKDMYIYNFIRIGNKQCDYEDHIMSSFKDMFIEFK